MYTKKKVFFLISIVIILAIVVIGFYIDDQRQGSVFFKSEKNRQEIDNISASESHKSFFDNESFRQEANAISQNDMAALFWLETPYNISHVSFKDENNVSHTMRELGGKFLLVNLWATWCAPCRAEMPDLENLQKTKGSDDFSVVTVSLDTQGVEIVKTFFQELGLTSLPSYIDSELKIMSEFRTRGLPASFLVDRDGYVLAQLLGPALWSSQDALNVVDFLTSYEKNGKR